MFAGFVTYFGFHQTIEKWAIMPLLKQNQGEKMQKCWGLGQGWKNLSMLSTGSLKTCVDISSEHIIEMKEFK